MKRFFYCLVMTAWICGSGAQAAVKIVGDVTDYVTITNAIASAVSGDVIRASSGTYIEDFNLAGLRDVMIDGGYDFLCETKSGADTVLQPPMAIGPVLDIDDSVVWLRDLVIREGLSFGGTACNGGGLKIQNGSEVRVDQCKVFGNQALGYGGGAYVSNSVLVVTNSLIYSNTATRAMSGPPWPEGRGGGIAVESGSLVVAGDTEDVLKWNRAEDYGGGICLMGGSQCVLSNDTTGICLNTASNGGGVAVMEASSLAVAGGADVYANVAALDGGGIWISGQSTVMVINSGTFIGFNATNMGPNVALEKGGGLWAADSSVYIAEGASVAHNSAADAGGGLSVSNSRCEINNAYIGHPSIAGQTNQADFGGGIYIRSSYLIITNGSVIHGNLANRYGGGLYSTVGAIVLDGSEVQYNLANLGDGGGMSLQSFTAITGRNSSIHHNMASHGDGGGVESQYPRSLFDGVGVSNNIAARSGGGLYCRGGNFVFTNAVISRNDSGVDGGGLCLMDLRSDLSDVFILYNTASNHGGGLFMTNCAVNLDAVEVNNNEADYDASGGDGDGAGNGGAIWAGAGDTYRSLSFSASRGSSWMGGNWAENGAAIYAQGGMTVSVSQAGTAFWISENRAEKDGGALYMDSGQLSVTGSVVVSGNRAGRYGGGFYLNGLNALFAGYVSLGNYDGNHAGEDGGGLAVFSSTLQMLDTVIGNNTASNNAGGAMLLDCLFTGDDLNFKANRALAGDGGALYLYDSDCTVSDLKFGTNSAAGHGGGVYLDQNASFTVTNFNFSGNEADSGGSLDGNGGGLYANGCRVRLQASQLDMSYMSDNSAACGGGLFMTNSFLSLSGQARVDANSAADIGGGLMLSRSTAEVGRVVFADNTAFQVGAGVTVEARSLLIMSNALITANQFSGGAIAGGGLAVDSSDVMLRFCTIISNELSGVEVFSASTLELDECLVYYHSGTNVTGGYDAEYSNIQGGYSGTGNISADPRVYAGDYHLTAWSPCRDQGRASSGELDYDGEARSGSLDIGFDEYVDADGDNLPNYVETDTGLWGSDTDMGTEYLDADSDNDGVSDGDEWLASTDPNQSNSVLRLTALEPEDGGVRVHWEGGTMAAQRLEYATDLSGTNWQQRIEISVPAPIMNDHLINSGESNMVFRIRASRFGL